MPPAAPASPAAATKPRKALAQMSQWQLIRRRFARHRLGRIALDILVCFYALALLAEFFAPQDPLRRDLDYIFCPPQPPRFSWEHGLHSRALLRETDPVTLRQVYREDPERTIPLAFFTRGDPYRLWGLIPAERHFLGVDRAAFAARHPGLPVPTVHFLGADKYGRDILARVIAGSRISLSIGLLSILVTLTLGILIGGVSGYVGGGLDNFIQRSMEIVNSFPRLPLWLALGAIMPREWSAMAVYFAITIVLSLLGWTQLARVVRGKILSLREEDYAVAARLLGASHARILFRHLLPGFTSHIIVVVTLSIPGMILGETALSFLGLGLRAPIVSWGVMLQDCMSVQIIASAPWLLTPVLAIILTVMSFNFLGDALRDAADPYER
ncbi:MAG: ABC transporter permease [Opitutaceae bacterium]|nr:ABC transporter permease [Opitutaceae bacterium]